MLTLAELRSVHPGVDPRPPRREILLHLTGNMERFIWGFDGKKYSEVGRIVGRLAGSTMLLGLAATPAGAQAVRTGLSPDASDSGTSLYAKPISDNSLLDFGVPAWRRLAEPGFRPPR